MQYKNIHYGKFIDRPNRFIAHVEIDGKVEVCHVKNTGRCKELLIKNAQVILEKSDNVNRKTAYDLVSVYKNGMLINMDSYAPNLAFLDWLKTTDYFGKITQIKPECTFDNSRFDFFISTDKDKIFIEVKGVTLENNGVVSFPDAPTIRGLKHINELALAVEQGYKAYLFFVVQMEKCSYFTPNDNTQPQFRVALKNAISKGVEVRAVKCSVSPCSLSITDFVKTNI